MPETTQTSAPDIPLENLAHFLSDRLTCAVWWSPTDAAVLGVYVECDPDAVVWPEQVRRIVSRRPAKCVNVEDDGSCGCDHLCLGDLEREIDAACNASSIDYFTDYGHKQHPGVAKLDELRDWWAKAGMGW